MSKKVKVLLLLINFVFLGHVANVRAVSPSTNLVQAIPLTLKPCTQDENPCNPSSCSYDPEKCKETPKRCVIGQPCEGATPATIKAKVEIKEIPSNTGQPSYMIKTESVQVISRVKVETNEKDEIKVVPDTKEIPNSVIILNPDNITDRLSAKPERISLDISCDQLDACKPTYEIVTKNTIKLLGVIPISYTSIRALDATTANQISESKPWFIRLAPFLFR